MKFTHLITLLFLSTFCFSQIQHNPHVQSVNNLYQRIDNEKFEKKIRAKYSAEKKEIVESYINELREGQKYYFTTDLEYTDWQAGNAYLKKVFNQLYKNDTIAPGDVRIILVRDPEMNMYAHEDGTIFVNAGMLARLNSEAQIASIFGHEWGHVTLGHQFKGYKSYIHYTNSFSLGNEFGFLGFGITGLVVRRMSTYEYENALISDEAEADENAARSTQRSEYNNAAGLQVHECFLKLEEREKTKVGYQKARNYIHTHPSTKKRIDFFKKAIENDTVTKKNFIVDSSYFANLKEQAIDETIYLLFKQHNFDECIEFSFVQHLKHPNDNFYLFFLIESIRRAIAADKWLAGKNFITGNYVLKPKKVNKPKMVFSEKYKTNTIGDFVYQYTIFHHLDLLFIDSLKSFANKKLLDTDTLEFITYADALNYFKGEAKVNGCLACRFDESIKDSTLFAGLVAKNYIEEYYRKLSPVYHSYMLNKTGTGQKNLLIIQGFNTYSMYGKDDNGEKEFKQNLLNYGEQTYPGTYETHEKLNLKELNDISGYFSSISNNLPTSTANSPYLGTIYRDYDCKTIFPEITEILSKYNYDKIFYVSAATYDYVTYSTDHCLVTMIDLKKNKIAKSGSRLGAFSSKEAHQKAFDMIDALNKK